MMSDNNPPSISFSKPISEPLPDLIAESIRNAVQQGELSPGQQLPSEPEFAQQLDVSRATLRDALRILVDEGVLERRRGVGTFVSENALVTLREGLETLLGTTELIERAGYQAGTARAESRTTNATAHLAERLEVPEGAPLLHLSRTRTASGTPVIHAEEYLPLEAIERDALPETDGDWSLYDLLESNGLQVVSAVTTVVPISADRRIARLLEVPKGHPLLLLRQKHFSDSKRPILYCENYHNSSLIEFHVIRRR